MFNIGTRRLHDLTFYYNTLQLGICAIRNHSSFGLVLFTNSTNLYVNGIIELPRRVTGGRWVVQRRWGLSNNQRWSSSFQVTRIVATDRYGAISSWNPLLVTWYFQPFGHTVTIVRYFLNIIVIHVIVFVLIVIKNN